MSVKIIDTLKPKNNGSFPIVEAVDVSVAADLRLPEALEAKADASALAETDAAVALKADASDLAETNATVATKANAADVATATANLQGQIDQIEISASAESVVAPEVAAARVGTDSTEYNTLKARLDAEETAQQAQIANVASTATAGSKNFANEYAENTRNVFASGLAWERGTRYENGTTGSANNRIRSMIGLSLPVGTTFTAATGYKITVIGANEASSTWYFTSGWVTTYTLKDSCNCYLLIAKSDDSSITVNDVNIDSVLGITAPNDSSIFYTDVHVAAVGVIDTTTGQPSSTTNRAYTDFISVSSGDIIGAKYGNNVGIYVNKYDADRNYLGNNGAWIKGGYYTAGSEAFIRLSISYADDRTVSTSDFATFESDIYVQRKTASLYDASTTQESKISGINAEVVSHNMNLAGEYSEGTRNLFTSFLAWEQGTRQENGTTGAAANRIRSMTGMMLPVGALIKTATGYKVIVIAANKDADEWYFSSGWTTEFVLRDSCNCFFVLCKSDSSNLSVDNTPIDSVLSVEVSTEPVFNTSVTISSVGVIDTSTGQPSSTTNRAYTEFFAVEKGDIIGIRNGNDDRIYVHKYDDKYNYLGNNGAWIKGNFYTVGDEKYIRLSTSFADNRTVSSSDFPTFEADIYVQRKTASLYSIEEEQADNVTGPKNGYATELVPYSIQQGGYDGSGGIVSNNKRVRSSDWFEIPSDCIIKNTDPAIGVNLIWKTGEAIGSWGWIEGAFEYEIPYVENRVFKVTAHYTGEETALTTSDYLSNVHIFEADKAITIDKDELLPNWKARVNQIQAEQGTKFTFCVQTDNHGYVSDTNVKITPMKNLTKYIGFDFICNLGDVTHGYSADTKESMQISLTEAIKRYTDGVCCPFLYALGNHEDDVLYTVDGTHNSDLDEVILGDELYGRTIAKVKNTCEIHQPYRGFYYYVDFDSVRVIVLNTRDIAWEEIGASDIDISHHVISQEQIDWLRDVAFDTDKKVIILSHVPLLDSLNAGIDNPVQNASAVREVIEANADNMIACFSGHTHRQASDTSNGITYIVFANGGQFAEVVMVDMQSRTIETKMIGYYGSRVDRSFEY